MDGQTGNARPTAQVNGQSGERAGFDVCRQERDLPVGVAERRLGSLGVELMADRQTTDG